MIRATSLSLILLLSLPMITLAQQSETLFSGDVSHGGFGSPVFGVTSVNGEASYLRGTRGAWMIKFQNGHAINVGGGWYRTESGFGAVDFSINSETPEMKTNYGGFELEYVNRSHKLIHYGAQVMIGGGTAQFRDSDIDLEKQSDQYFAVQPGVNAHMNITNWFRISGGIYYRFADGASLQGTSNSDLSGTSAILGLRFGKF